MMSLIDDGLRAFTECVPNRNCSAIMLLLGICYPVSRYSGF